MTKSAAIRHARANVSELYRFGDGWKFSTHDTACNAWRESYPTDYHRATWHRRLALIESANRALGHEPDGHPHEPGDFLGGPWTDYVEAPTT
jgi:hypothetical protein